MKFTDPQGVRVSSARYFVDFLASQRSDFFDHRIGIINFGDIPPENPKDEMLSLTELEKANLERIKNFIKTMELRDTSFIRALRKAFDGFKEAGDLTGRQKVIVFFTDGEPDDYRKLPKSRYFAEIKGFVDQNLSDCRIYVVAVDVKGRYWRTDERYWNQITRGGTYLVSKMSERELDKVYTSIVLQLLRVPEIRWDNVPSEGLEVRIEPYLEKVSFSILKENPNVELVIYRADGRRVTEEDPDVKYFPGRLSEIYSINDPEPGIWRYKIERGKGKVEVGKAVIPIEVRLLSPKIPHPLGKPIKVIASFLKRDGGQVKEHPAYRLWLGAKIITPLGEESFELVPVGRGIYEVEKTFPASQRGEYVIELTMKGGNLIISEAKVPIEVKSIPYITVVNPKAGAKYPLRSDPEVEVNLLFEGKLADPADLFVDDPNSILWAQVGYDGEIINSLPLRQDRKEKWVFKGKIEGIRRSGKYKIFVQLGGHLKSGETFELPSPDEIPFYKRMTIFDFPIYRWYLVLIFLVFVGIMTDWFRIGIGNRWWRWRFNMPRLRGMIRLFKNGEEIGLYLLSEKRKFKIPNTKAYIVAKRVTDEEGYARNIPEIHHNQEIEELHPGSFITLGECQILYEE